GGQAPPQRPPDVAAASNPGWIVSPAYDLAWFITPALGTALVALLLPDGAELGFVGWLVLVVLVDVAHTWATLYRAWLDPVARRERPGLLWGVPLAAFAAATTVHAVAAPWFWTGMAYVAVFHFVRQQQGFAALYRARAGVPWASLEARVEHWTVAALCVFPIVWWHANLPRRFAWFTPTDFVPLPAWVVAPAGIVTAALFAGWAALRLRGRRAPGRDLWVLSTAATWLAGIVLTDGDAAFTLANVVAHGVPYFALVHHVGRAQWRDGEGALSPRWFAPAAVLAFLALPAIAALAEELAWDALVWREHFFGAAELPDWVAPLAVPLLATPQLVHYALDGFVWKLGPPGAPLRRWLLSAG
ncbi:MAG: hypothetical protein ACK4YP_26700, partial [Myxococcota bacterium]